MKKIILSIFLTSFIILNSCKEEKKDSQNEEVNKLSLSLEEDAWQKPNKDAKTYAELSIRKGDNWEPKKFGGGEFKNVESLELPEGHSDHAYYIRYEGPGWENSQVGFRMYLDWRNAIDIWGKKIDTLVLPYVGQKNYEDYHHDSAWGQDILKAGKSLGLGGYGRFINDSVAHFRNVARTVASVKNTSTSSSVNINYDGWKTGKETINLEAKFTIYPTDRYSKISLKPSDEIEGLTTGIVKFKDIELIKNKNEDWGYIATYGTQTLVSDEDQLGMAIFYKTSEIEKIQEGPHDHLVIFKPTINRVSYYILAAWEQEKKGITTKEAFVKDLEIKLNTLQQNGKLQ
ncbi:DUF4861 family protein [Mesonia aestuariivivens]|uniref:DUF4861 domain-containing protein n=1 Tax=Mesonia aestuariivivens TaxID=2796128 RepID=A0ABS6W1N8_9FLAO|nr:DUF4861 family protein [Mesonia aestuariivivens]MBW2961763.1 DUF4861 domain-containing protein [Mesonia aestuariivivens]